MRIPLSKRERFEVLRRDDFTCQYCGRKAPEVVLEVDHVFPVSCGGGNEMENLVTACRECNRGKGVLHVDCFENKYEDRLKMDVQMLIDSMGDFTPDDYAQGKESIFRRLVCDFSFTEVCDAMTIAYEQYCSEDTLEEWEVIFSKLGGICFNRRKEGYYGEV